MRDDFVKKKKNKIKQKKFINNKLNSTIITHKNVYIRISHEIRLLFWFLEWQFDTESLILIWNRCNCLPSKWCFYNICERERHIFPIAIDDIHIGTVFSIFVMSSVLNVFYDRPSPLNRLFCTRIKSKWTHTFSFSHKHIHIFTQFISYAKKNANFEYSQHFYSIE